MEGGGTLGRLNVKITGDEKSLQDALKKSEAHLKATKSAVGDFTQNIGTLRQEYRALSKTSLVGKSPEEILNMQKRLAELKDQIGDLNSRITSMSKDPFQKVGEGIGSVSTLLAGASGAATLFGANEEKLNELTQKTIGLMAIAKAAQEASVLTKERAYGIAIKQKATEIALYIKEALTVKSVAAAEGVQEAATTKLNGVKKVAITLQNLWNKAVMSFPVLAIVAAVAAITAGIVVLVKNLSKHNTELKNAKKATEEYAAAVEALKDQNAFELEVMQAGGAADKEVRNTRISQIREETKALEKQLDSLYALQRVQKKSKDLEANFAEQKKINEELTKLNREFVILDAQNTAEQDRLRKEDLAKQQEANRLKLEALKKLKEDEDRINRSKAEFGGVKAINGITTVDMKLTVKPVDLTPLLKNVYAAGARISEYYQELQETINEAFTSLTNQAVAGMAETIGGLAAGAGGGEVFKAVGEQVASFTESLGRALIATGIGSLAFKKVLLTPGAAIAAGGLLLATSAFVRAKLKSGPAGSSGSAAGGGGGGNVGEGGTGYRTIFATEQQKQLVGTLKADGKDLVATVYMENKRTGA